MATKIQNAGRGLTRSAHPTQTLGWQIFALLVAMTATGTAEAQDFRSAEAIVRARMAQADAKTALAEVTALRTACAKGDAKACGGRKTAEAKVAQLVGCAAFKGAAEQSYCLATIARISAETTQKGMETYQAVQQGTFVRSRTVEVKTVPGGGTTTTTSEEVAELTTRANGGIPCVDYTHMQGGTAETPPTLLSYKCPQTRVRSDYDSRPIVPPADGSTSASSSGGGTAAWWAAVLGGAGAGAAMGCGIGGLAQPSVSDEKGFSGSGCGYGSMIGAGGGALIGLAAKIVIYRIVAR